MHRQQKWQDEMRARHRCIQCGKPCRRRGGGGRNKPRGTFYVRCVQCNAKRRMAKSYQYKIADPTPTQLALRDVDKQWAADSSKRRVRDYLKSPAVKDLLKKVKETTNGTKGKPAAPYTGEL